MDRGKSLCVGAGLVLAVLLVAWGIGSFVAPPALTHANAAANERWKRPRELGPASVAVQQTVRPLETTDARTHRAATSAYDPASQADGRAVPHPISDERRALMPPWSTFEEVNAAFKAKEFTRGRELLKQRQAEDRWSEDWQDFYVGLELTGECLESPNAANRARAEVFIAEHRASPLRRHVRRKCLAGGAVAAK